MSPELVSSLESSESGETEKARLRGWGTRHAIPDAERPLGGQNAWGADIIACPVLEDRQTKVEDNAGRWSAGPGAWGSATPPPVWPTESGEDGD